MHFGIDDGSWLTGGGLIALLIFVATLLSVWRYNAIDRPEEERERAEAHEAEERERHAAHENDVPL